MDVLFQRGVSSRESPASQRCQSLKKDISRESGCKPIETVLSSISRLAKTANQKPPTKIVTTSTAEFQSKMAVVFLAIAIAVAISDVE